MACTVIGQHIPCYFLTVVPKIVNRRIICMAFITDGNKFMYFTVPLILSFTVIPNLQ